MINGKKNFRQKSIKFFVKKEKKGHLQVNYCLTNKKEFINVPFVEMSFLQTK